MSSDFFFPFTFSAWSWPHSPIWYQIWADTSHWPAKNHQISYISPLPPAPHPIPHPPPKKKKDNFLLDYEIGLLTEEFKKCLDQNKESHWAVIPTWEGEGAKWMTALPFQKVNPSPLPKRSHKCSWKHRLRLHMKQWFLPEVQLGHFLKSSTILHVLFMSFSKFASLLKILNTGERVWSGSCRNQSTTSSLSPFSEQHSSFQSRNAKVSSLSPESLWCL